MTHLYLIRHGEATTQVQPILQDDGLTLRGVMQVEHLRDRLAATGEIAADVLIASTLPRARQTAEILAPVLNLPIIFDDEVQELRIGEAEGMHVDEFKAKFGGYNLENEPFYPVAPGGENWGQFVLRVGTALDRIIREYEGKSIVIACHGGVIESSFLYFFGMNTLALPGARFDTRNASITYWLKSVIGERPARWRLVRYNDDLHTRDMNAPVRIPWQYLRLPRKPEEAEARPTDRPTVTPSEK